jgi:antitoxin (DNA-binding transcriptional repressor) of toxin-antitoxin stability system
MVTVSIRDLRTSFPKVAALLQEGEEVWITRRGKIFARIEGAKPRPKGSGRKLAVRFGPRGAPPVKLSRGGCLRDWMELERDR